jgi:ATP-dependent DNA ligase
MYARNISVQEDMSANLHQIAFDALWIDGEDFRNLPLLERKCRLRRVVARGERSSHRLVPVRVGVSGQVKVLKW